ncbi:hypothetical protein PENTCL1PPCAC_15151, partial [Pristionchus entomophagus]
SIIRYYQYVGRYPKGPRPLPFIGNLLEESRLQSPASIFRKIRQGTQRNLHFVHSSSIRATNRLSDNQGGIRGQRRRLRRSSNQ